MCDILGTGGNDTLVGTQAAEVICGLGGDDLLTGGDGDTLIGGPGDDNLDAGPSDCAIPDDSVTDEQRRACESVESFTRAVERSRDYLLPPPPGGGGNPPPHNGPVRSPGVISETTGAGQVYVALARYLKADSAADTPASVIAVILNSAVNHEDGEIRFLMRCSYAGDGRVTLAAITGTGERIELGSAGFHCSGNGDDPLVTIRVSDRGRTLLEGAKRVRIRARVVDLNLEQQPKGSLQPFVLRP